MAFRNSSSDSSATALRLTCSCRSVGLPQPRSSTAIAALTLAAAVAIGSSSVPTSACSAFVVWSRARSTEATASEVIEAVKAQGLEGVIAKRRDSLYEPGRRSGAWVKMRVNKGRELIVYRGEWECSQRSRTLRERAYPKLIHYNKLDKGGHFAAWEQPEIFSQEVRAGFRPLRKLS